MAAAASTAETYPVKAPKAERPSRQGAAFFLQRKDGAVLVRSRPPKGLLGGMTEIPGSAWRDGLKPDEALTEAPVSADWKRLPGFVEHVFTHFALRLAVFVAEAPAALTAPAGARWVAAADLDQEALPSVMRKVIAHARERSVSHPPPGADLLRRKPRNRRA